jgi:hypothetical protein
MPWINSILEILKKKFGDAPFLVTSAVKTLQKETNYSKDAIRQAFYQLTKKDALIRNSRGIYKVNQNQSLPTGNANLSANAAVTFTAQALIEAEKILKTKGINYMITGPSTLTSFHHHLARRSIHLIYVIDGAGEYACVSLGEKKLRAFLNPSREQIDVVLQALEEGDLFVIREYAKCEGNMNGRATIEKAIIDTYFEATRHRIPFSEMEVGRIIANAFRVEKIDLSRLLRFASRRGIRDEIETIVKELVPSLKLSNATLTKSAKAVIAGLRS